MLNRRFFSLIALAGLLAASGSLFAADEAVRSDDPNIENIMKNVAFSVVKVEARNGIRKIATGVVIDKEGTIVTTALISPREEEIFVLTFDGKKIKADFKGFDMSTGLAVIQAQEKSLAPIRFGTATDARPGAWVASIGFSPENTPAITQGIISSTNEERIRLNLWVLPGSSGSPVVNSEGRMIGVLRGTYVDEQPVVFEFRDRQIVGTGTIISRAEAPSSGMALAVPVDVVLSVAGDILKNGKVLHGWIGFTILESVDDGRLEIEVVEPKGPADAAKLKPGDVIVRMDGRDLNSGAVFSREIRKRKPGTDVVLGIVREGAAKDVKVKLGEYTEEDGRRELETRFPGLFPPPLPNGSPRGREEFLQWENRKYIGVTLQALTTDLAAFFGAPEGKGLLVTEFDSDSPAQKAGLKIGDVLLKADGRTIESINDVTDSMRRKKKDEKIKFEVLREKKTIVINVPVAEQAGDRSESEAEVELVTLIEKQMFAKNRQELETIQAKIRQIAERIMKTSPSRRLSSVSGLKTPAKPGESYRI